MRKRNSPIRMIAVHPAPARKPFVSALARRLGFGRKSDVLRESGSRRELRLDQLDLDQRVREVGEW